MIESLTLTNWMCHNALVVPLAGITVLVGDNESGKSAVMRALRWVCLNQWEGSKDQFVAWDAEVAEAKLVVDGHAVIRRKGKDVNEYLLDDKRFGVPRLAVPESIAKLLNLSSDNFQSQDDPSFWLSLKKGEAASALNEIFNLSAIDHSLTNTAAEVRHTRSRERVSKERLVKARKELKSLAWVKEADADLRQIEALAMEIKNISVEISDLARLASTIAAREVFLQTVDERMAAAIAAIKAGSELLAIETVIGEINSLLRQYETLEKVSKTLSSKQAQLAQWLKSACPLCGRGD